VEHTYVPKKFKPVEEYLKEQERFSHLFKPVRQEDALKSIQEMVDEYWKKHEFLP
jgi:pyruvate ferredoxin oxidoreductase beta subunit